jgi:hypothetical protein
MSKPWIHAVSSAKRFGGVPEDYIEIHNLMDSSKATIADSRHRALTHNAWFVGTILEKIFGVTFTNSAGKQISKTPCFYCPLCGTTESRCHCGVENVQ